MISFKEFIINSLTSRHKCRSCFTRSPESDSLISCDSSTVEIQICNPPQNAPYDKLPLFFLGISAFIRQVLHATIDALISPYSMDEFSWTKKKSIYYNNIVMIISYIASLFGLLFMKRMLACVSARMIYLIVLMVVSLSFFIYIPWPGKFPQLIHQVSSNGSSEMVGCDYFKQSWCLTIPKLHEIQFFLAPVIFSSHFLSSTL